MKKYNKEFQYRRYHFNISVELNTGAERHPDGARFHTVITNDMGVSNYYVKKQVEDRKLKEYILEQIDLAKDYVDKREGIELTPNDVLLLGMGFN